jgi:hypothetical protein
MLWRPSAPPAGFIEPCLPTLSESVPSGPEWVHEIKHDGYRFICRREGDGVRVFSRRGNDYTDRVPAIADALGALKVKSVTLDGEGVVCDPDGVTDFVLLWAALGRKGSRRAFLYAFDVLELDGRDLRDRPWGAAAEGPDEALAQSARRHPVVGPFGHDRRRHALPPRLRHGPRRDRRQAPRSAVSLRAITGLDQGQEPGRADRDKAD